jgi:hypothetical protein
VTVSAPRGAPRASAMMSDMAGRPIGRRLAAWAASLAVLGAFAISAAAPAAADTPTPPPWVIGALASGDWIGYRLSSTSPPVFQRNPSPLWGPVTLSREMSNTFPLSALASEAGPGGQGWPSTWSSNGITLKRADQFCAITQGSCQYYVTSGAGQQFFFAASGGGAGAPDLNQYNQFGLTLTPPQQPVATFTLPAGGALPSAGSFTFDGSGSSGGLPGALTYQWTLTPQSGSTFNQDGPQSTFTPPASIFNQNGQYCVSLVVTASDGAAARQGPSCFSVTVSNPPTPPQAPPTPPAGPAQTPAPPAAAGPAPAASLSFAKPLPNFAVPVPGAAQQVTVIWLWKPDWFRPTPSGVGKSVRTAGRPKAVKRASVSVTQSANRTSPSATPWLAGLGAFGIFGAGWVAFRRRNLRSSLLD